MIERIQQALALIVVLYILVAPFVLVARGGRARYLLGLSALAFLGLGVWMQRDADRAEQRLEPVSYELVLESMGRGRIELQPHPAWRDVWVYLASRDGRRLQPPPGERLLESLRFEISGLDPARVSAFKPLVAERSLVNLFQIKNPGRPWILSYDVTPETRPLLGQVVVEVTPDPHDEPGLVTALMRLVAKFLFGWGILWLAVALGLEWWARRRAATGPTSGT